ncbi:NUDIX domain-containing protein [Skermanella sp. TT6]|uniref:NUDIX domain-containing protein n=1 Tax=Skermanella cutis TaxID=2775420 RepID=A0ABX7BAV8_9PROT|nr:NUDIX domain-containing protein [Skermanella sp. TT6]
MARGYSAHKRAGVGISPSDAYVAEASYPLVLETNRVKKLLAQSGLLRTAHLARVGWLTVARPLTMGVRAIIRDADGAVLMIRHSYVDGWHLPGGGVDRNETVRQAMAREVREEVGVEVVGTARMLGLYARFRHRSSDHVSVFVVDEWRGTPEVDGLEIVECRFFALDALPRDTTPATRRRLAELAGGGEPSDLW